MKKTFYPDMAIKALELAVQHSHMYGDDIVLKEAAKFYDFLIGDSKHFKDEEDVSEDVDENNEKKELNP